MAGVPFIFGNATTSIPLSNLDADFNTPVTIGNTTVGLGNTVTTLGNVTLNNVTITSGSINAAVTQSGFTANAVIYSNTSGNLTTSANLTFDGTTLTSAGLSDSGNLTFTGTGNRIRGDFSNATVANRVAFQTSTTNGNTNIAAIPNGTSTTTSLTLYNSTDPDNSSRFRATIQSTSLLIASDLTGTGTYIPMTFLTGGSERLRIDTSGNVGIGTSSPVVRLQVNSSGSVISNFFGNNANNYIQLSDNNGTNTCSFGSIAGGNLYTYTAGYSAVYAGGAESMRIDSSGNVGIGTSSPFSAAGWKALSIDGTSQSLLELKVGGVSTGYLYVQGTAVFLVNNTATGATVFQTNSAERMRIDSSGNVGIGATANASALLDVQSTTKGVRMPNMTTTQKNAISSPAAGLMVFDTTLAKLCVYSGSAWQTITSI